MFLELTSVGLKRWGHHKLYVTWRVNKGCQAHRMGVSSGPCSSGD